MIKYKFAYDSLENITNISSLTKSDRPKKYKFICLNCGNEMVPALGEKRVKHFRHKANIEINCSSETYLHKLTKLKFHETYQNCLDNNKPFNIKILINRICNHYENEFLITCNLKSEFLEFDLTKYFRYVYLETKENSFIPDILLETEKGTKIFFEVFVTHSSEAKKINSDYRIIEFKVDSEEDIKTIESCFLEESNKIKFYNFKALPKFEDWCNGECPSVIPHAKEDTHFYAFVVYKDGGSRLICESLEEIEKLKSDKINILYLKFINLNLEYISGYHRSVIYKQEVIESYLKKIKIKNCFLCRYHAQNKYSEEPIFCKFLKIACISNEATDCQYFRPDPKVFSQYQEQEDDF